MLFLGLSTCPESMLCVKSGSRTEKIISCRKLILILIAERSKWKKTCSLGKEYPIKKVRTVYLPDVCFAMLCFALLGFAMLCYLLFAICYLLFAICYLLFAICYLLFAICYLLCYAMIRSENVMLLLIICVVACNCITIFTPIKTSN